MSREHPRSRGENTPLFVYESSGSGTSPLTRGKLSPGRRENQSPRNIPAHAGKTLINQQSSVPDEEFYITPNDEHVGHDAV